MLILLVACTPKPLPDDWTVAADGISVAITREPYGIVIRDGDGNALLGSTDGPDADGYAPIGFTHGTVFWDHPVGPGWTEFTPVLDPWTTDWTVVDAVIDATSADLVFAPASAIDGHGKVNPDDARRMHVVHTVTDGKLRVQAHVEGVDTPRAWEVAFVSPADEGFMGFGMRFNKVNQRGVAVFSWNEEGGIGTGEGDVAGPDNPVPSGEAISYYPVPFGLSTQGYGFWADTTWRSEFDLATDRDDAWRMWHIGPDLAFDVFVPKFADPRPWPMQVIDAFTDTVGRPMKPPDYAFGPRRRVGRGSVADGEPEIEAMRHEDLAITAIDDAVHFLPNGSQIGIEDQLAAFNAHARDLGYRVNAYYNGYFAMIDGSPIADVRQFGLDHGYFLKNADGNLSSAWLISGEPLPIAQVDFSNPDAFAWYGTLLQWAFDVGYTGFMYDFGEYVQPEDLAFDGTTGEEYHDRWPVEYDKAAHDALEAGPHRGDWLAFARAGYTGSSQYVPFVWTGDPAASFEDSDGLPSVVRASLNLGVVGVPFSGSDIGGFHCLADGYQAANGELWARWIEAGALFANMQDQNACSGALGSGQKASIWTAPEAKDAWRTYARLHTRLFPYFRTLADEATATGAPVMRQPWLLHPEVRALADVDDAWYVGDALYVAPVVARGAVSRPVAFPPGTWLDWRDGSLHAGGATETIAAPLGELPLFLADGAVIPLLDPAIDTLSDATDPDVIDPTDVAEVYDVVAFATNGGGGSIAVYDGSAYSVAWTGGFAAPDGFTAAATADELATCDGCYLAETLPSRVMRIRVSTTRADVVAGGLTLHATGPRRARWDVYVAP